MKYNRYTSSIIVLLCSANSFAGSGPDWTGYGESSTTTFTKRSMQNQGKYPSRSTAPALLFDRLHRLGSGGTGGLLQQPGGEKGR